MRSVRWVAAVMAFVLGGAAGALVGSTTALGTVWLLALIGQSRAGGTGWVMPIHEGGYTVGCGLTCYPGHTGQDFAAPKGTPVRSSNTGIVVRSVSLTTDGGVTGSCTALPICGSGWYSYGNLIVIADANKPEVTTYYAHLDKRAVPAGSYVSAGDHIGRVGDVGNSDGPHLHYEVRVNGAIVDPLQVLREHGVQP
jgi:murein DD-endopeptidase MepM/ murein hydrolase activator NlpD